MRNIYIVLMASSLFLSARLSAQEVFVRGDNQAAVEARKALEKTTPYKTSPDAAHAVLLVDRESWSPDILSPATVAITMKLISPRGELLWSKTQPIGSQTEEAIVLALLKDLAKARPRIHPEATMPVEGRGTSRDK